MNDDQEETTPADKVLSAYRKIRESFYHQLTDHAVLGVSGEIRDIAKHTPSILSIPSIPYGNMKTEWIAEWLESSYGDRIDLSGLSDIDLDLKIEKALLEISLSCEVIRSFSKKGINQ